MDFIILDEVAKTITFRIEYKPDCYDIYFGLALPGQDLLGNLSNDIFYKKSSGLKIPIPESEFPIVKTFKFGEKTTVRGSINDSIGYAGTYVIRYSKVLVFDAILVTSYNYPPYCNIFRNNRNVDFNFNIEKNANPYIITYSENEINLPVDGEILQQITVNSTDTPYNISIDDNREGYYTLFKLQDSTLIKVKSKFVESGNVTISIYNNKAEKTRLDKTPFLTLKNTINGFFKDEISIINPVIELVLNNTGDTDPDYLQYNYIYIGLFGRYYFVDNMTILRSDLGNGNLPKILVRYSLTVDVLMSFRNDIKKLNCFITRQEYLVNKLLVDTNRPIQNLSEITYVEADTKGQLLDNTISFYGKNCYVLNVSSSPEEVSFTVNGSAITSLNHSYILSDTGLKEIIKYLYSGFNLFEAIPDGFISLKFYPFDIVTIVKQSDETIKTTTNIYIGNKKTSVSSNAAYIANGERKGIYNVFGGDLLMPNIENYYDLNPYCSYQLYIPYVGWIELDNIVMQKLSGKKIVLYYIINFVTHENKYILTTYEDFTTYKFSKHLIIGDCELGCDIPISSSNFWDTVKNTVLSVVGAGLKSISKQSIYSAQNKRLDKMSDKRTSDYKTQKEILVSKQRSELANDVTDISINTIMGFQDKVTMGGSAGGQYIPYYLNNQMSLRIQRTKLIDIDSKQYSKVMGYPYCGNKLISELYGYTEVGACHIENIPNATTTECDEIEAILKSGFICPDKPSE